jgi:probable rRNA maturation factor
MSARAARRRPALRLVVTVVAPPSARDAARGLGAWLEGAAPGRIRGEVVVALVGDARMRALNREFRGHPHATDVLSFPAAKALRRRTPRRNRTSARAGWTEGRPHVDFAMPRHDLGEIVIAVGVAARQATRLGHSLRTEIRTLALHGLLHLLGYDHEHDEGEMGRLEERLRRRAGLPAGLIGRSSPRLRQ